MKQIEFTYYKIAFKKNNINSVADLLTMPEISCILEKDIQKDFKGLYSKLDKETKKMINHAYKTNNENELFTSVIKKENTANYIFQRIDKLESRMIAVENRLNKLENKT